MTEFEIVDAVRRDVPLLILLAGGTGAGKTESALRLATGLANGGAIVGIDTERGRMLHKADDYTFKHLELDAPFTPERYAEAIRAAAALNPAVILIDSGSHEYDGDGGVLDIQTAEFERMGKKESARMASWIVPKSRHKGYVRELLRTPCHTIVCHRAEDKVEIGKDAEGKTVVRPKASLVGAEGWIPICEKRLPFEATISLLLTQDAPGVPKPIKLEERHRALVPLDRQLSEETGRLLAEWAAGGSGPARGPSTNGIAAGGAQTGTGGTGTADESDVTLLLELANQLSGEAHDKAVAALASHREKHGGTVDAAWLSAQIGKVREKLPAQETLA